MFRPGMSAMHLAVGMMALHLTTEAGPDPRVVELMEENAERAQKRAQAEQVRLDPIVEKIRADNAARRKLNFDKQKKAR